MTPGFRKLYFFRIVRLVQIALVELVRGYEPFQPRRFVAAVPVEEKVRQIVSGIRQPAVAVADAGIDAVRFLVLIGIHQVRLAHLKVVAAVAGIRPDFHGLLASFSPRNVVFTLKRTRRPWATIE